MKKTLVFLVIFIVSLVGIISLIFFIMSSLHINTMRVRIPLWSIIIFSASISGYIAKEGVGELTKRFWANHVALPRGVRLIIWSVIYWGIIVLLYNFFFARYFDLVEATKQFVFPVFVVLVGLGIYFKFVKPQNSYKQIVRKNTIKSPSNRFVGSSNKKVLSHEEMIDQIAKSKDKNR